MYVHTHISRTIRYSTNVLYLIVYSACTHTMYIVYVHAEYTKGSVNPFPGRGGMIGDVGNL